MIRSLKVCAELQRQARMFRKEVRTDAHEACLAAFYLIVELTDELEWVYDNSHEQHILSRAAKVCPPEER